jgi:hypothetical protein
MSLCDQRYVLILSPNHMLDIEFGKKSIVFWDVTPCSLDHSTLKMEAEGYSEIFSGPAPEYSAASAKLLCRPPPLYISYFGAYMFKPQ